ncbi:hypothetical protein HY989_00235 [Candidatus Micrarchaeota archaeon]|nr:hypothetical protein [Candidatus Micrarchaeota archaeon]
MELKNWRLEFRIGWDLHFKEFDKSVRDGIIKKFDQMKSPIVGRGLHSSRYLVEEVGGYRIAYIADELTNTKKIHFVGNHKQYEQWYSSLGQ